MNVFGEMHLVSSTVFDIGVYLVVVGMVLDLRPQPRRRHRQPVRSRSRTPVPQPESTEAAGCPRSDPATHRGERR